MTALPLSALTTANNPPRALRVGLLLCVITAAALLCRIGFLARPFESDSGLYIYMGKTVVEGRALYRDFYETKPPGVAMFTAGLYWCFGDRWWPYILLQGGMRLAGG